MTLLVVARSVVGSGLMLVLGLTHSVWTTDCSAESQSVVVTANRATHNPSLLLCYRGLSPIVNRHGLARTKRARVQRLFLALGGAEYPGTIEHRPCRQLDGVALPVLPGTEPLLTTFSRGAQRDEDFATAQARPSKRTMQRPVLGVAAQRSRLAFPRRPRHGLGAKLRRPKRAS